MDINARKLITSRREKWQTTIRSKTRNGEANVFKQAAATPVLCILAM